MRLEEFLTEEQKLDVKPKSWLMYSHGDEGELSNGRRYYDFNPTRIMNKQGTDRPTPTQIAKASCLGERPSYFAYAGRCYEFKDQMMNGMKQFGYKGMKGMDSETWADRKGNDKHIRNILRSYNFHHVWVYYNGKHYDSMNPEGVNHPSEMKFFKHAHQQAVRYNDSSN